MTKKVKILLLGLFLLGTGMQAHAAGVTCNYPDLDPGDVVVRKESNRLCASIHHPVGTKYWTAHISNVPINNAGEKLVCAGYFLPVGYTSRGITWSNYCPNNAERLVWNRDPLSKAQRVSIAVNQSISGYISTTDPDGDSLIYKFMNVTSGDSFQYDNQTGYYEYTPKLNFAGVRELIGRVTDGNGGVGYVYLTIKVGETPSSNIAPVASDIIMRTHFPGVPHEHNGFIFSGTDPDGTDSKLKVVIDMSSILHGTIKRLPHLVNLYGYQPNPGFDGEEIIRFTVTDSSGASDEGYITFPISSDMDIDNDGMPNGWGSGVGVQLFTKHRCQCRF